jgi:RNA polymerase-binding transcription factor DksA
MTYFDQARTRLVGRRGDLDRRLASIESDLERHGGVASDSPEETADAATRALAEFMETLRHEVSLIEAAIWRIDSREYDCCMSCGGTIRTDRLELLPYAVNCARCSRDFPRDYLQQLRGQHSNLRRAMISILGLLADVVRRCDVNQIDARGAAPTLALLKDLGRQLPEHFSLEEKNGFLEDALAQAPRYGRRAEELMQEHPVFSREIFTIVKDAETAGGSGVAWRHVRERFMSLTLDLLAHEQGENDIMESAFLDDLGSGH